MAINLKKILIRDYSPTSPNDTLDTCGPYLGPISNWRPINTKFCYRGLDLYKSDMCRIKAFRERVYLLWSKIFSIEVIFVKIYHNTKTYEQFMVVKVTFGIIICIS